MQNNDIPAEGKDSAQTESESALRGAACSPLDYRQLYETERKDHAFMRKTLERVIGERDTLRSKADNLHLSISVFFGDWRAGDFRLPEAAAIHMSGIDEKYRAMGKVLFDMENARTLATADENQSNQTESHDT